MAQLTQPAEPQSAPNIPATSQLLAVAWLRWRIFLNGFRRRQTGPRNVGSLILTVLLRLLLWPIFALMGIAPAIGAGFFAYYTITSHHEQGLAPMLAGLALLWQFVALNGVNIAASAPTFEPSSLLRFPLRFPRYLVLRLLLGLLTPSTIVGCLALFATAIGITLADSSLALPAFVVLAIYAALNIFLSRTIAVWLERWLSTRRAREIFGVLMALVFVSFQAFNLNRGGAHAHAASRSWLLAVLHASSSFFRWLPPGFAGGAILETDNTPARLLHLAALLASTALIFAALAYRLHKQFLGEYLSEGAPRTDTSAKALSSPSNQAAARQPQAASAETPPSSTRELIAQNPTFLSPVVAACLRKEWIYLRSGGTQLVRLLTPLVFVFIFSRGVLARHPSYLLSGSVGYVLITPLAMLYNIFGADGEGVQLYLLAPIRLRDVVVAKNIASLAILLLQSALAWTVVWAVATAPIPLPVVISSALWIVFFLFLNLTVGTLRSIQSPRKAIVPGQAAKLRTPTGTRTSGLVVLASFLGSMLLLIPVNLLARRLHSTWLASLIFAPLAAAAIAGYGLLLQNVDRLILKHRDRMAEELCGD